MRWCSLRDIDTEGLQQGETERPLAMTRVHIDVTGLVKAYKLAAPGPCIGPRKAGGTERIVCTGHNDAVIGQFLVRHGRKIPQYTAAFRVGGSHKQCPLDA